MSDPEAPDGTSSEAEESQVGGDKPTEPVNPMVEIFAGEHIDQSPEEKSESKKRFVSGIPRRLFVYLILIPAILGIYRSCGGGDEVQTQQARDNYVFCRDLIADMETDGVDSHVVSAMDLTAMDLAARRSCAAKRGIGLNMRLGFDVLTRDEYECVGELSISKRITPDDMSDWFLGYDLGPQVHDSMWELFYECGDVRRFVARNIIFWWGDDLGVGMGDESFVECLIEELSEDLALDWLKLLPPEDPPSPAYEDLWNEMGLSYQARICAPVLTP
jgi:hypothetical protein